MPEFNDISTGRLMKVHPDLITLFFEVVKVRDCSVVSGLRSLEEQQALYAKGRYAPGEIVTFKDGIDRRSKHQTGQAVDVIPYPEGYDEESMIGFGELVLEIADRLKQELKIDYDIIWGGEWKWKDYAHFEI